MKMPSVEDVLGYGLAIMAIGIGLMAAGVGLYMIAHALGG